MIYQLPDSSESEQIKFFNLMFIGFRAVPLAANSAGILRVEFLGDTFNTGAHQALNAIGYSDLLAILNKSSFQTGFFGGCDLFLVR